jgi:hypothetical protein
MLFLIVSRFNLLQSFTYTPYLFYKNISNKGQFFLFMDPEKSFKTQFIFSTHSNSMHCTVFVHKVYSLQSKKDLYHI